MDGRSVNRLLAVGVMLCLANGSTVSPADAQSVAVVSQPAAAKHATVTIDVVDVPRSVVLKAIAEQAGLLLAWGDQVIDLTSRVSLHVRDMAADEAIAKITVGTGIKADIVGRRVVLTKEVSAKSDLRGIIVGTVTDVKNNRPIRGATVVLDSTHKGVLTNSDGVFRLVGIGAGEHVLHVRMLGYGKVVKGVTVTDDQTTSVAIALDPSVNGLEQVVVTGTVIPTQLKAVPNAITVITAKDIEQRGITKIDQLFRGDIPGLFALNEGSSATLDEVFMYSRGTTGLSYPGQTDMIKTYVDGVQMADPRYLSQIDPKSIERIEVLTGPQASTIYGSGAINGVMQIFTKRGTTSTPQVTLNLLSGLVENNFSPARTPQHEYSSQITGLEGRLSYSAGGSWNYIGPWTPYKRTARLDGYGGGHFTLPTPIGNVISDLTLRVGTTTNHQGGWLYDPVQHDQTDGFYNVSSDAGVATHAVDQLSSQTIGLTVNYAPSSWWSHEFGVGKDFESTDGRTGMATHYRPYDTLVSWRQSYTDRRSMRYNTTLRIPMTSLAMATLTGGVDGWQSTETFLAVTGLATTGTLGTQAPYITRQPNHNTGAFFQGQLGMFDQLFLTYGLRAEWNPAFGKDAIPAYAPRYGIAYSRELGPLTAKVRASYGRSTRPPGLTQKLGTAETFPDMVAIYGPHNSVIPNPALGPENQQGGEGGLEVYLGNRASLVITRYNQTVNDLITTVPGADSVRSLQPNPRWYGGIFGCEDFAMYHFYTACSSQDAQGYAYAWVSQNLNVSSLRNQGWELQGTVTTGPLTTRGTYSWTKSRSIGVTPAFLERFAAANFLQQNPQYIRGATFTYLPEHTWALGVTYAAGGSTIALNFTGTGPLINGGSKLFFHELDVGDIRLQENLANLNGFGYITYNKPYVMTDLNASHRFAAHVEGIVQVQNLTNYYAQDQDARLAVIGRQSKAGLRVRF